jgi:Leucine-rich repeat (LRR) protein
MTLEKDFSNKAGGFANHSSFIFHVLQNLGHDDSGLSLDLSYNGLEHSAIDLLFFDGSLYTFEVVKLDVSHNRLRMMNISWFSRLTNLTSLDLSYNQITALPLGSMPVSLKDLTMAHNYLTELEDGVFENLDKLEKLYFSFNTISEVGVRAFRTAENMKVVDLSYNQLTTFEPWPCLFTSNSSRSES